MVGPNEAGGMMPFSSGLTGRSAASVVGSIYYLMAAHAFVLDNSLLLLRRAMLWHEF